MPALYCKWITRDMVRENRADRFVFGDNVARIGMGGQAAAMRGEWNAIGVATKWRPDNDPKSFFTDHDPRCWAHLVRDIDGVEREIERGATVIVAADGLGTGLSELPTRAPRLHQYIIDRFTAFPGQPCPWGR